VLEKGGVALPV